MAGGEQMNRVRKSGVPLILACLFVLLGAASPAGAAVLTVDTTGNGSGYVTSNPSGINCGHGVPGRTDCSVDFPDGEQVVLTAVTSGDFEGFSGACTSQFLQCTTTVDEAQTVTADFGKYDVAVNVVTNDAALGQAIRAQGAVQGGGSPKQGTLQFRVYGPDDPTCGGPVAFTSTVEVIGNTIVYHSGDFVPNVPGVYRWVAEYSGDENHEGDTSPCNDTWSEATVFKNSTSLTGNASGATIGNQVLNRVTLSGGMNDPSGTITMSLYPPSDTSCTGNPVYTDTVTVNGNGTYLSGEYTPGQTGTWRWVSVYSGDTSNASSSTSCAAAGSRSIVTARQVTLTNDTTDATVGAAITNTVALSGGMDPTGSITTNAYGPSDTTCSGPPIFSATLPVSGNGSYGPSGFATDEAGQYRWTTSYSGDDVNAAASTACGTGGGTSAVAKATPSLSSPSPSDITVGEPLPAQSTLSAGYEPGGTVTLTAFGPGDADCSAEPAYTSDPLAVNGNGNYGTEFTPDTPGAYRWTVSYSGDGNNEAAQAACGQPANVAKDAPSVSIEAGNATIGEPVSGTATLTGGFAPTGTITLSAFGPNNLQCGGEPAFAVSLTVSGNGQYGPAEFTPEQTGEYRWTAAYSGDDGNEAASTPCGEPGATSTVAKAAPTVSATAPAEIVIGDPLSARGTIGGAYQPAGTMTLTAYGPDDPGCSAEPAFTSGPLPVDGSPSYDIGDFTPATPGTYRWTATYSGDGNNEEAASECGAAGATSVVAKASPALALSASGDVRLGDPVRATATLSGGHQPGGEVTFSLFGPDDESCSAAPVFESPVAVTGDGAYPSPEFTPSEAGTYRWVASYSGDGNNEPVTGSCADAVRVKVAPLSCPKVKLKALPYTPKIVIDGPRARGVRARILVSRPSRLKIRSKLTFRLNGKRRTRNLGRKTLGNGGTRNLRLPLPRDLRRKLPKGTRVTLTVRITAIPRDPRGCTSPPTFRKRIKTRVVRVLTADRPRG
jgi:hypothetical protein